MSTLPSKNLVAVDNPRPGRDYEVRCETSDFTCLCPMTGQPDFATVTITYVPDQSIVFVDAGIETMRTLPVVWVWPGVLVST